MSKSAFLNGSATCFVVERRSAPQSSVESKHGLAKQVNSSNFKTEWDRGVLVLGTFKLDHLHPFKLFLFWKFSNFFTFILGGQFLLPQRANLEKREITQLQKLDETEGFQCLGHSNWTICSPLRSLSSEIFPTFPLSYWEANSYYPRGPIMGK